MSERELDFDLDELSSAEDFLDYFGIAYDPAVVHVNRLHILQRFHDYLDRLDDDAADDESLRIRYTHWLTQAYNDFVDSDAQTEKVFKVFRLNEPVHVEIALTDLMGKASNLASKI